VRAWRGELAGDLGSSGAAGDARGEEGRGGRGTARWGRPVRERERETSAEGLGRASWAELAVREGEEKERVGRRERGPGERGKKERGR
jgi:hypothetical protein